MDEYCECICHYIWSMRRLFASLQSQTHCTDSECFTEHPGYEGGSGTASDPSTVMQLVLVLLLWAVVAIILFRFRPSSLRGSGRGKPSLPSGSSNDRRPPPSPPAQ